MTKCKAKLSFSFFSGNKLISCIIGREYDLESSVVETLLKDGLVELVEVKPEVTEPVQKPKTRKKKAE